MQERPLICQATPRLTRLGTTRSPGGRALTAERLSAEPGLRVATILRTLKAGRDMNTMGVITLPAPSHVYAA